MFIFNFIFKLVLLFYISLLLLFIIFNSLRSKVNKYNLVIYIISCNRIDYLNYSIFSIYNHIINYEDNLLVNYINVDQGTQGREFFYKNFKISNIFCLNPVGYSYSFQIIFSYLYSIYTLMLEEDWMVIKNIEKRLKYYNFLYISMEVLSYTDLVYGLYLRHHPKGMSIERIDKHLNISYLEVYKPWKGFCYTNGAAIYKTKYLKRMEYKHSEYETAKECIKQQFHIGLINWKYKQANKKIQYVFEHIGKLTTRNGICKISLY